MKRKILSLMVILLTFFYISNSFFSPAQQVGYFRELSEENSKLIALTFDDGPSGYTQELLDGLKKEDVKATFFLIGKNIEKYSDTVKNMYEDGHLIGNHTWAHTSLFEQSVSAFCDELEKTYQAIEKATGAQAQRFFRPPHGWYIKNQLEKIDSVAVLWSNDPADWKRQDADYVYNYLINYAHDGALFLLHDTKKTTVEGVLRAICELKAEGYRFVRADELLCRNGDSLYSGIAYRGCKSKG